MNCHEKLFSVVGNCSYRYRYKLVYIRLYAANNFSNPYNMEKIIVVLVSLLSVLHARHAGYAIEPKSDATLEQRIFNGHFASEGQFPWQVSLRKPQEPQHFCGGAIIDDKWILTAAHCLIYREGVKVVVGTLFSNEGTLYDIASFHPHMHYAIEEEHNLLRCIANDIALVKLKQPIQFSKNIAKIPLETRNYLPKQALVAGWGQINDSEVSRRLKYANMTIIPLEECIRMFGTSVVHDYNICTKPGDGLPCHGDSGGALVANGKLIGVDSFADQFCGSAGAAFTGVSHYLDWIKQQIADN